MCVCVIQTVNELAKKSKLAKGERQTFLQDHA